MIKHLLGLLLVASVLAPPVSAQVPDSISYQGYLEDGGIPVNNANATLTFRLWNAPTGGTQVWTEIQTGVSIIGGLFSTYLGSVQTLKATSFTETRWLSIAIGNHLAPELTPRTLLAAAPYALSLRGIRVRPSTAAEYAPSLIGGYWKNTVSGGINSATIGGGGDFFSPNHVGATAGTVGGGAGNTANAAYSTVGGGYLNVVQADIGAIAGGSGNLVTGVGGFTGGGHNNSASDTFSVVTGGELNAAEGAWSSVPGGFRNRSKGSYSLAAGYNAKARHDGSFVFNGDPQDLIGFTDSLATTANGQFLIRAPGGVGIGTNAPTSPLTVAGLVESKAGGFKFPDGSVQATANLAGSGWGLAGNTGTTSGAHFVGTTDDEPLELRVNGTRALRLEPTSIGYEWGAVNVIGGTGSNSVAAGAVGATISGGGSAETSEQNTAYDHYGTIGGGFGNTVGTVSGGVSDASSATISGGFFNAASGSSSTIGGGNQNTASGRGSSVAGGLQNQATDSLAYIGGGRFNQANAIFTTIAGGGGNTASGGNVASDSYGTIGGGYDNQAGNNNGDETDAYYATVAGGRSNMALEDYSAVGGGFANQANGSVSTVAGGWSNHADGERSFIGGGRDNRAGGYASVVPGGSGNYATGSYSFAAGRNARSLNEGCFTWADNSTTATLDCNNDNRWLARAAAGVYFYTNSAMSTGAYLAAGGSGWNILSDKAHKTGFLPIDHNVLLERIAATDISSWSYVDQGPGIRHVGPTAQDFNALLPFLGGEGETYINSLDADGVTLAAIQGLYHRVQQQRVEIDALKSELVSIKSRLP